MLRDTFGMPDRFEASTMRGKTVVCVTGDGLTVDERPGAVYSFSEAALSPWTIGNVALVQGTALHLRSGRDRFVLGGFDHRVGPGTRLEAPPDDVRPDAWLSASDFDEMVAMIAPQCGWDVRRPTPGERIRCVLVPNTSKGWDAADFPGQDFMRRRRQKEVPQLAVDVGNGGIWVVDPESSTVALRFIDVVRFEPASVVVADGVEPGDVVVTAGVQALHPGQKVRLLGARS